MRHINDLNSIPPSSAARLGVDDLLGLPGSPVLHFRPVGIADTSRLLVSGIAKLSIHDSGTHVGVTRWCDYFQEFSQDYQSGRLDRLVESHDIRYLRTARMCCVATKDQVADRSKTVSRRMRVGNLHRGAVVNLTDSNYRKGVRVLGTVVVRGVMREKLSEMQPDDLPREGFPVLPTGSDCPRLPGGENSLEAFARMFRSINGLKPGADPEIWRVEWEYL